MATWVGPLDRLAPPEFPWTGDALLSRLSEDADDSNDTVAV
jgi:hypothetical protein